MSISQLKLLQQGRPPDVVPHARDNTDNNIATVSLVMVQQGYTLLEER